MITQSCPIEVFSGAHIGTDSTFFHIFPGEIALLQGFGFMDKKARWSSAEREIPQMAMLEMLMFREAVNIPAHTNGGSCLLDLHTLGVELDAVEPVIIGGKIFGLSKYNNTLMVNIPGSYKLSLNDPAAVGCVRVFLRIFTKDEYPWETNLFIGETLWDA